MSHLPFAISTAALSVAAAVLVGAAGTTRATPPPAHTGGFGEPTCQVCHFDAAVNAEGGSIALAGVPDRFAPGATYELRVTLSRAGLSAGGFQLTARFDDGTQAGSLAPGPRDAGRVGVTPFEGVDYASHRSDGVSPAAPGAIGWTVLWTAPVSGDAVIFHVAANAADDDDSPLGDFIYTTSARAAAGK